MQTTIDSRAVRVKAGATVTISPKNKAVAMAATNDPRWGLVAARDATADGTFFYAVKTTGVYCRPSCAARMAKPENVLFYATCDEAEKAGFRACRRCKPRLASHIEVNAQRVVTACRMIEAAEEVPSLDELAARVGMSASHFHRTFKAVTGLTPQEYAAANRKNRVRETLARSGSVTSAIYGAGFSSSGRFYEKADDALGMTPTQFRAGGAGTDIFFAIGECSLGSVLVAQSSRGVCAILLGDEPAALARDLQDHFPKANLIGNEREYEELVAKVVGLIEQPELGFDLPLDIRGTAFQERVWKALRQIPPGTTATYSEIAKKIGEPNSARAVAKACAANKLAVAIPCHRVVRNDGSLSGYRWGVERKKLLIDNEAAAKGAGTLRKAKLG